MFVFPKRKALRHIDSHKGVDVSRGADGGRAGTYPAPYVRDINAEAHIGWSATAGRNQVIIPQKAQEVMRSRNWKGDFNIQQKVAKPAYQAEIFRDDPRGIVGSREEYQRKADYFSNYSKKHLNSWLVNPEQTSLGTFHKGVRYTPAGHGMRVLLPPGKPMWKNDNTPTFRGY